MVLEPGDDDLVVLLNVARAPALGHEVDAFSCAAHKNNLAGGGSVQETAHFFARPFVGIRGSRRQGVGGAVDVRVLVTIERRDAVDNRVRLLGGGSVIKPHQRPPVYLLLQDREVAADEMSVERARRHTYVGYDIGAKFECFAAERRTRIRRRFLSAWEVGRRTRHCRRQSRVRERLKTGG